MTDFEGNEYQRIEYTPYGELWVEKKTANEKGMRYLPYKFTAKEQDEETGLYYYGARYLDAKYSRWLSADPAVGEYIPQAPVSDETKKHNEQLPGMGGVFNVVNFQLYHYAGNNPVKYVDPDGRATKKGVDINLLPVNEDKHLFASNKILNSNTFFVAAHGNRDMIYEYPNATPDSEFRGAGRPVSPKELATRIKNHVNYKKGMTVVLWACNTGKQGNNYSSDCYAQQLADELGEDVKVLAPDSYYFISTSPNGTNFIGNQKADGTPDLNSPQGYLRTFRGKHDESL